ELESLQRQRISLDRAAILVRAQFQTREFEDRFIAIGMPYRIGGGLRFYQRAAIRAALAYLRLVQSSADGLAFERIVNVPKRGLGDKALQRIHQFARAERAPLFHAASRITETDELTPQARRQLANFVAQMRGWQGKANELPHPELTELILDESRSEEHTSEL